MAGLHNGSFAFSSESAFPAERLVVEITESSLFADMDLARTIVTSLENYQAASGSRSTISEPGFR